MTAAHYQLDNLIIFIDKNNFQQTGTCDDILRTGNLSKKFESFNCFSQEIDGHDHSQIYKAISKNLNEPRPNLIVANTTKGKGIDLFENKNEWHHSVLSKKIYEEALINLDKNYGY